MNTVSSPSEAFFIAAEMERRAVRLYERAQTVFAASPCAELAGQILRQEREHLARFSSFLQDTEYDVENAALLSAESAQIIFSGGLMEAHRCGAFLSAENLLSYAMGQEKNAIETYTRFAELMPLEDERAQAFLLIANEEKNHFSALDNQLSIVKAQKE